MKKNKFILILFSILFIVSITSFVSATQDTGYLKECLWSANDATFSPWNPVLKTGVFMNVTNLNQDYSGFPILNYTSYQSRRDYFNSTGIYPLINSTIPTIYLNGSEFQVYIKCQVKFGEVIINDFSPSLFSDLWAGTYFTDDFNLSSSIVKSLGNSATYSQSGIKVNDVNNKINFIRTPRAFFNPSGSSLEYVKIGTDIEINYTGKPWSQELKTKTINPYSEGLIIGKVNLSSYPSGYSESHFTFGSSAGLIFVDSIMTFYINSTSNLGKFVNPPSNKTQTKIKLKDLDSQKIIYDDYACTSLSNCPTIGNYTNITYTIPLYNPYPLDLSDDYTINIRQAYFIGSSSFGDVGNPSKPPSWYADGKILEIGYLQVSKDVTLTGFTQGKNVNVTLDYTFKYNNTIYSILGTEVYITKKSNNLFSLINGFAVASDGQRYLTFGDTKARVQYNPVSKILELNISQKLIGIGGNINKDEFILNVSLYRIETSGFRNLTNRYTFKINQTFLDLKEIPYIGATEIKHDFIFQMIGAYSEGDYAADIESIPVNISHKFYGRTIADLTNDIGIRGGDIAFSRENNFTFSMAKKMQTKYQLITLVNPSFQDRIYELTFSTKNISFMGNITSATATSKKLTVNMPLFSLKSVDVTSMINLSNASWHQDNKTYFQNIIINVSDVTLGIEALDNRTLFFDAIIIGKNFTEGIRIDDYCYKMIIPLSCVENTPPFLLSNKAGKCNWNSSATSTESNCQNCTTTPTYCSFYNEQNSCKEEICGKPTELQGEQDCSWIQTPTPKCSPTITVITGPGENDKVICQTNEEYTSTACAENSKYKDVTITYTGFTSTGTSDLINCPPGTPKVYQVRCPSYVELPIFGILNLLLASLIISLVYKIRLRKK